jgi:uncharacterized protein (DUF1778 family)
MARIISDYRPTRHSSLKIYKPEETSVTDFVLANAMAAAERVIESHEKTILSARDWAAFYDALLNPPEPNERLKEAARRYRERVGE